MVTPLRPHLWPRPLAEQNVDQQQNWQDQADSEMNPARPRAQAFAARVIKRVAGPRAMRISRAQSRASRSELKSPSRRRRGFSSPRLLSSPRNRQARLQDNSNMPMLLRSEKATRAQRRGNICRSASIELSLVVGVAWRVKYPGWRTIAFQQQRICAMALQQGRSFFA